MSYVAMDARPVDFILCQYGNSKNLFRGLKKHGPTIAERKDFRG